MGDLTPDIAVFGSSPLASLVAGLLASAHGRKVCLVAQNDWTFRLTTGFDLSVAPVTRPDTWAMLKKVTPETARLLARIGGKTAYSRIDPVFIAETDAGAAALSHMRYMASAFGHAVEKVTKNSPVADPGVAYRLRDALLLSRAQLAQPMARWLEKAGVRGVSSKDVTIKSDGSVRIVAGDAVIEARMAVLADDAAILSYLNTEVTKAFSIEDATSILTDPVGELAAMLNVYIDRGVILNQSPKSGIAVLAAGRASEALPRIGASLQGRGKVRRSGERAFRTVTPPDGAPFIGILPGSNAFVLAGFGLSGAFLAPAIARFIAGTAIDDEAAYFTAHAGGGRSGIAEYRHLVPGETAA